MRTFNPVRPTEPWAAVRYRKGSRQNRRSDPLAVLAIVVKGNIRIEINGQPEWVIRPWEMVVIPPRTVWSSCSTEDSVVMFCRLQPEVWLGTEQVLNNEPGETSSGEKILPPDERFRQTVFDCWNEVKTVAELATRTNYSTSGFIKRFKRIFGESPYRWMSHRKAAAILADITEGNTPLKEVAARYNFSSYQHFADFCKTQYGVPPTRIGAEER